MSILINSCTILEPVTSGMAIQTEFEIYSLGRQLIINVMFENNLEREIKIINSGLRFPEFLIEKRSGNSWKAVGGSIYTAIYYPPKELPCNGKFSTFVKMFTGDIKAEILSGEYRLYFFIVDKKSNELIPDDYRYSNSFRLIE